MTHLWLIPLGLATVTLAFRLWPTTARVLLPARDLVVRARATAPHTSDRDAVLVLVGTTYAQTALVSALRARRIRTVTRSVGELAVEISSGVPRIYETVDRRDVADFGLVQFAGGRPDPALFGTLAGYLTAHGSALVNGGNLRAATRVAGPTKVHQYIELVLSGERVPDVLYLPAETFVRSYESLVARFGTPFVLKSVYASGGRLTRLIRNEHHFTAAIQSAKHLGMMFFVQRYVPNNGTILLLVVDGEVRVVIHRCSTDGSGVTSVEETTHATLFATEAFEPAVKETAVRCADVFGYDLAAVTVIQDRLTSEWSVLGVDPHPVLGEGAHAAAKASAYTAYAAHRLRAFPGAPSRRS